MTAFSRRARARSTPISRPTRYTRRSFRATSTSLRHARTIASSANDWAVVLEHRAQRQPRIFVVPHDAKRFTIEETFRDQKDLRFGLGMNHTRAKMPVRRDRLLLLAALAQTLLTLLGAAGERCGLGRSLKANTSTKRTMSLFRQGCFWYEALPNMPAERADKLLQAFGEIIREHRAIEAALGCI